MAEAGRALSFAILRAALELALALTRHHDELDALLG